MHNVVDTTWRQFEQAYRSGRRSRGKQGISVSFISDLLSGEISVSPDTEEQIRDFYATAIDWYEEIETKLDPGYIAKALRFQDINDLRTNLGSKLNTIVSRHRYLENHPGTSMARKVAEDCGFDPTSHQMIASYLSGVGLCMHTASLGVAIARANGFEANIAGHPSYFNKEISHHYGISLLEEDRTRTLIIPSNRKSWKVIKNRNFQIIRDH